MATTKKAKPKAPKAKPKAPAPSKKPPKGEPPPTKAEVKAWRALTSPIDFVVERLQAGAVEQVPPTTALEPGTWFAVVPTAPPPRRYQFIVQWQGKSRKFILCGLVDGAAARLPAAGCWLRALDAGRIHAVSTDRLFTRRQLAAVLGGGHEPTNPLLKPPNT